MINIKALKVLKEVLVIYGVASLVVLLWQGIELLILKELNPNKVDTIIAMILTLSLYGNLNSLESKIKKDK